MKMSGPLSFLKLYSYILLGSILLAVGMPKESIAQIPLRESKIPDKDGVLHYSTEVPADATEAWIIDMIKQLNDPDSMENSKQPMNRYRFVGEAPFVRIAYVDQLLKRYPSTKYRHEATIAKLKALDKVAPTNYNRTRDMASITSIIKSQTVPIRLVEQSTFYGIRAFQLLAKHEKISEERWIPGAIRQYEDFIRHFPKSEHAVHIYGFWVREAIRAGRQLDASDVVNDMIKKFPDHELTKLSLDRVNLMAEVGQQYNVQFTTYDGKVIKSSDLKGKVLIVHYWHPDSTLSTGIIGELISFYVKFHDNYGLQLVGVAQSNDEAKVNQARKQFMTAWPQCKNEIDSATGKQIQRFHVSPAFLLVDAEGKVANVAFDPADLYMKLQVELLKKP